MLSEKPYPAQSGISTGVSISLEEQSVEEHAAAGAYTKHIGNRNCHSLVMASHITVLKNAQ